MENNGLQTARNKEKVLMFHELHRIKQRNNDDNWYLFEISNVSICIVLENVYKVTINDYNTFQKVRNYLQKVIDLH